MVTDTIERLRDILTIKKLASEVPLKTTQFEKITHITDEYLDGVLGLE